MQKMSLDIGAHLLGRVCLVMKFGCSMLVGALVACSHIDEETPRSFVRLVAADTTELRKEISSTLEQSAGTARIKSRPLILPKRVGLDVAPIDFGWVTEQGAILAYNKKFAVVLLFEPIFSDGKVAWNCVVYPDDAKPQECGSWKPA